MRKAWDMIWVEPSPGILLSIGLGLCGLQKVWAGHDVP
jgi:hypothetical protein